MKRKSGNAAVLIIILLLAVGLIANYSYFQPKKELEATKEKMLEQLSGAYGKQFKISEIKYSKALGDKEGIYNALVYPAGDKNLTFQVHVGENGTIIDESYKETKWRSEAIQSWKPFMAKFGPVSYAVNITIPDDIAGQYDLEDTYDQIYQKHKQVMSEYIFVGQIESSFDKEKERGRVAEAAEHLLQRSLQDFSIEWLYYEEGKQDPDVFEMRKEIPSYSWRMSKKDISQGLTQENLDRFLTEHKNKGKKSGKRHSAIRER